jgi:uncharacterized membrane protein
MADVDNHAKQPVAPVLVGPYGHPFHPILVTVPIGAWISSVVLDVGSHVGGDAGLVEGARWLIGIGVIGALAAAAVGFLDFLTIPAHTPAHRVAVLHMSLNLAVTAAFAVDFAWRLGDSESATGWGRLALSVVGVAVLAVSGALGGKLAYHYGVRVADEETQLAGFTSAPARTKVTNARRVTPGAPRTR